MSQDLLTRGQNRGQIVCLHRIITSYGLDDCVVDLGELFRVARAVILVDRPRLDLVWPSDLPELRHQSMECAPS
jgi:hypothetical protein